MPILRDAASQFGEDRCTTLAAAIAYYALVSLARLLYVLLIVLTTAFSLAHNRDDASAKAGATAERERIATRGQRSGRG